MQNQKIAQEILGFNKNAVKMSFDALSSFSDQAAKSADQFLGAVPCIPEEGKEAVGIFFKENQKGLTSLRACVEAGLEIDWTTKEAPAKGLEAMESLCNDAFSQAAEIKKESRGLAEKATKQLPKEAKPFVEFWSEALDNGFQIFQGYVSKNFELAKKILADVSVEAPKAEAKAAK